MTKQFKGTILIAVRNPTDFGILFEVLRQANFQVLIVENGGDALEQIAQSQPDMIFLDITLPDLDGFDFGRLLGERERTQNQKVVFLNFSPEADDWSRAMKLSADDYVTEPTLPAEIIVRVEKHFSIRVFREQLELRNTQLQEEISRRKEAELESKQTQRLLQTILDSMSEMVMSLNTDKQVIWANKAAVAGLFISDDDPKPLSCYRVFLNRNTPCEVSLCDCPIEQVCETKQMVLVEHPFVQADGKDGCLEIVVTPMFESDGRFSGIMEVARDITARKREEKALLKLAALEERQRLARDFHDSVTQSIHSLVLFSQTLDSALESQRYDRSKRVSQQIQGSARQILKETRLMLYELQTSPEAGNSINLFEALKTRIDTVERRSDIAVQLKLPENMTWPEAWNKNLFWVTIEALNNSIKHAQAREIRVILKDVSKRLELVIEDDGKGFETDRSYAGRMGLRNMNARAKAIGGTLEIASSPGNGTSVRLWIEMPKT